jgi:transposase
MGMEACSSAHRWARFLSDDRNDAQAILSAVRKPDMRFVSVKSVEQQSVLACHRMHQGWQAERTALINRTRGLLAEFGLWLGRSSAALVRALLGLIQEETHTAAPANTAVPGKGAPAAPQGADRGTFRTPPHLFRGRPVQHVRAGNPRSLYRLLR